MIIYKTTYCTHTSSEGENVLLEVYYYNYLLGCKIKDKKHSIPRSRMLVLAEFL